MLQTKPSGSEIKSILMLIIWLERLTNLIEGQRITQEVSPSDWYLKVQDFRSFCGVKY